MLSKSADKSSSVGALTSPLSILIMISLCTFSSTDSVECCFLDADCNGLDNWLFLYELAADWLLPFLRFWK